MSGIAGAEVGSPQEYGGSADTLNPEELFVALINHCLMLVFFHFVDKFGIDVGSYTGTADGTVEKTANGLRFTRVDVKAQVAVGAGTSPEKVKEAAQLAEKYCLVSNSLKCPVTYEVLVKDAQTSASR